ncbi:MAG: hypothetical protein AAGB02_03970, partial [Pseudomonadota bacterium]
PSSGPIEDTTIGNELQQSGSAPGLREASVERFERYAGLAPPERLSPPPMHIASVTPAPSAVAVIEPAVTAPASIPTHVPYTVDLRKDAARILGKEFTTSACEEAASTLQKDAWALDAMVELGYCEAIAGNATRADEIFSRLLEYTPDNYQALVGRALLAAQSEDRNTAQAYFQEALNALPPVAESNRIVSLMARL